MTAVLKTRTFPVASELFSPFSTRAGGSKPSLAIARSTKASASGAVLEMLGIFSCFALGMYIATRMYGFALGLVNAQLPGAFATCFGAGYAFCLFVAWAMAREEARWCEAEKKRGEREGEKMR